uniref:Cyclin-dependent kinase inhibitor 1C n=1 Tax=Geotrypetes seraphini TaxID=260995 RepID=A0A6P8QC76_GEOSA|nr:cyclin-dependent kinase inhibitor 1C [Geotrypetes seraphini]
MAHVQLPDAAAWERQPARRTGPLHPRPGVCKNLFGRVDHEELRRELKSKLREMSEADRERWDYDFETDSPLAGGRLQWEAVPGEAVPAFYRETLRPGEPWHRDRAGEEGGQENCRHQPNSGLTTKTAPKGAAQITDLFAKRKRTTESKLTCGTGLPSVSPISPERTPRKRLR